MTKKITGLLILITVMAATTFATEINSIANVKVQTSFSQRFTGATDVNWVKADSYLKASFQLNDQVMFAYFDESGKLLSTSRNLSLKQLPINLQTEVKKMLLDNWMTELMEFADGDESSYYASFENADQKIIIRNAGSNSWSVVKKIKK